MKIEIEVAHSSSGSASSLFCRFRVLQRCSSKRGEAFRHSRRLFVSSHGRKHRTSTKNLQQSTEARHEIVWRIRAMGVS
ncbi:hypothetical protein COCOBI_07-0210 [Coccomyxa sp. Obi]|nr:hypothetical protein COCOBI_07-0210 [Coccomyxa sp. Obi]